MTASSSERRGFTVDERRAIEIGREIHRAVIDEGRREGVIAYMYHDGKGRAWFEKYDRGLAKVSRRFSPELEARIRQHKDDLKIYARSSETDDFAIRDGDGAFVKTRREIAVERCRVIVESQNSCVVVVGKNRLNPSPVLGSEPTNNTATHDDKGERYQLTNEK